MTAHDRAVVFDSWAWMEVLKATTRGKALAGRYLDKGLVITPALAVTEVVGKAWRAGLSWEACDQVARVLRARGKVHPLDDDTAALAAQLSVSLRKRDRNASYADAVMLATARTLGLPLVSNDGAFAGCPDVRSD